MLKLQPCNEVDLKVSESIVMNCVLSFTRRHGNGDHRWFLADVAFLNPELCAWHRHDFSERREVPDHVSGCEYFNFLDCDGSNMSRGGGVLGDLGRVDGARYYSARVLKVGMRFSCHEATLKADYFKVSIFMSGVKVRRCQRLRSSLR